LRDKELSKEKIMRVAVLGTGMMGTGMAHSLLRNGLDVTVWNRHPEKARPLADDGATVADSLEDAVRDADVVLTILFDEAATSDAAATFLDAMKKDAVWMQSATVGPAGARRLGELAAQHSIGFVDAPVAGTRQPAENGALVVLVAGQSDLIDRVTPVLDAIGSKTVRAGESVGDGSSLKLACNAWIAMLTAGTAQSLVMCEVLGIDPKLFLEALDGGPSSAPYMQMKGKLMMAGDFEPSFALGGLLKDLNLMVEAVSPTGASTSVLSSVRDAFDTASTRGHDGEDVASVITSFGELG
jgi:3-hydroxyisobutyrate dehydrogenase